MVADSNGLPPWARGHRQGRGVLNLPRKGIDMSPEAVALGGRVRDPPGRGLPVADVVLEQVQLPNGESRGNGITLKSPRAHGPKLSGCPRLIAVADRG